ncbi:Rieske (2Fe-2S) protein [Actinacidiphila bryophytorum]|uniref:Cytochrome bc1 complex Rieske iron-sulfur subunit n=1 Tax=Actinacidiphila bryophytorum TaxID=1436133 RepID=A0A9W4EDY6_9ACTN|nr:Rieske (2Fe-2S) protein [Actinacidiphila bryophytorum]MBM9436164.1 Rieske (2Fe-2S) protein [Actinacidiphila bryophytorum]MBN6545500.1 Rieske (2Fe-2S) protein [Actinacidiphila bryophytorum]CAG7633597.1 Cytochrome bc1 complex Rieske iron-sulfur subunit [Actinacidiphila bryophytorum]
MTSEMPACRRTVLRGVALAGAAGVGLTACGGKNGSAAGPDKAVELGAASEVPVGGAKLYRNDKVVVSQPQQGTFKAFSAVCTHQGCVVDSVDGTTVSCPCHGSQFDAETGAVVQGPATKALPAVSVTVAGGRITAGPAS